MLKLNNTLTIPTEELQFNAIRSQGAGGQNVNKVSTAIHLRFDITASSLPEFYKSRLLHLNDQRVNKDGVIVIKAQQYRTQEKNREDALNRLGQLIRGATIITKNRRPTKPTKSSQRKRMDKKNQRGKTKNLRGKVVD
ncbi:MAG: ribosome-associated protein [Oceanicoccus sp.]|jgi:ribosome-associated protein